MIKRHAASIITVVSIAISGAMVVLPALHRAPAAPPTQPTPVVTQTTSGTQVLTPEYRSSGRIQQSAPAAPTTPMYSNIAPKQAELARSVTREYPYRALLVPNDPYAQTSWMLSATHAYAAWDRATGGSGAPVVIADIDTGFALAHEDLFSQWYQNSGETGTTAPADRCWTGAPADKSTNNCDDDANGYVDDWRGWNFAGTAANNYQDVNNNPQAGVSNPAGLAVSHGTQTAGLAGAANNNGRGIASLNWNVRVMPLQALSDDGEGYTSAIIAAIHYAVDNGASIINMSLGGPDDDPALSAATQYAYDHRVVVVAAAGNCGTGNEAGCDPTRPGAMSYPALNRHVIAVGATDAGDNRASFSSYGPGLDVVAPGYGSIIAPRWTSANPTSAYVGGLAGTSFASPIVASYVSLLRALAPNASVDTITALVDATARKPAGMTGQLFEDHYGHGLIDIASATATAATLSTSPPTLLQTGSYLSEHTFRADAILSSGCVTTAATPCTIWAQDSRGYDRYLPYQLTNSSGAAGWQWPASILGGGEWWIRASGATPSTTPYYLMGK